MSSSSRAANTRDAIIKARIERFWAPLRDRFANMPPTVRFLCFVLLCSAINVAGLNFSQQSTSSMYFFDAVGTAIASFVGGLASGVITALLSAVLGAFSIGHPEHAVTAFPNAACAVVWSILPRLGSACFGADIFDANRVNGYRRQLLRVFVLGFTAALAASLVGLLAQITFLPIGTNQDSNQIAVISSGSYVTQNNFVIVAALLNQENINLPGSPAYYVFFISSMTAHIPDKIIATVTSLAIIVGFLPTPRIRRQTRLAARSSSHTQYFYNKARFYVIFLSAFYLIFSWIFGLFGSGLFATPVNLFSVTLFLVFFAVFLLMLMAFRPGLVKAPDPFCPESEKKLLFHARDELFTNMPHRRDVFEDTIKFLTILFALAQLVAINGGGVVLSSDGSIFEKDTVNFTIDGLEYSTLLPTVEFLVAYNVILLTGFRYLFVMGMRLLGKI